MIPGSLLISILRPAQFVHMIHAVTPVASQLTKGRIPRLVTTQSVPDVRATHTSRASSAVTVRTSLNASKCVYTCYFRYIADLPSLTFSPLTSLFSIRPRSYPLCLLVVNLLVHSRFGFPLLTNNEGIRSRQNKKTRAVVSKTVRCRSQFAGA